MTKSITRFLFVIPAAVLICFMIIKFKNPSALTINHWILPMELKACIDALIKADWHQAWLHLSQTVTLDCHILVTLILLTLWGIKYFFNESENQRWSAEQEVEDLQLEANDLGNKGLECCSLGKPENAIDYYVRALNISRQIGDHRLSGITLGNLGNAYLSLKDVKKAINCHEQALGIFRQIGDRNGEGSVLGNLGKAHIAANQVKRAIWYNKQSLEILEEINSPYAPQMREWVTGLEKIAKGIST